MKGITMSKYLVQSINLMICLLIVAIIISLFMSQIGITIVLIFLTSSMMAVSVAITHMGKRIAELERRLESSGNEVS